MGCFFLIVDPCLWTFFFLLPFQLGFPVYRKRVVGGKDNLFHMWIAVVEEDEEHKHLLY